MLSGVRLSNVRKARQACSRQQSWQGLAMGFAQIQYRASHPAQAWAGMASPSLTFKEIDMFRVIGKIDSECVDSEFDNAKELELAMREFDKEKEKGGFSHGLLFVLHKGEPIRSFEWL